jgi:hypothetical protein
VNRRRLAARAAQTGLRGVSSVPRRVYIVGGTGSGKSTLAARLAPRLGLEPVNLDEYRYTPAGKRTGRDVLTAKAADLAAREAWLAEGIYITWALPLIEAADLVVWLDPPPVVAAWRVLRRAVALQVRGGNPYGWRKTLRIAISALRPKPLPDVLASSKNLNPSRTAIHAVLQPHQAKTVRVAGRRDLDRLIDMFQTTPATRSDRP